MILDVQTLWIAETNSWIISADHKECVIVDIPPDPSVVLRRVKELALKPVAVIATHGHVDHVGGVSSFLADNGDTELGVHIHPSDKDRIVDMLGTSAMLAPHLLKTGVITAAPEIIVDLDHGQVVSGAGLRFEAIHTPGHTQGSICLKVNVRDEEDFLFSGDHLFKDSIGRTDLPGGSLESLISSMKERIFPLPDELVVLPGHGEKTTLGREKRLNPYLQFQD